MTIDSGILRGWYDHVSSKSKEEEAIAFFEEVQWWGSRTCPKCASSVTVPFPSTDTPYRCPPCDLLFSVRTGTEWEYDKRPLWQCRLDLEFEIAEQEGRTKEQVASSMLDEFQGRTTLQCPRLRCRSLEVSKVDWPAPYRCRKCRKHFSARTGTAFEHGKIPLWRWLDVIITYGKGGRLTIVALAEKLDVKSQNTAWVYQDKLTEAFSNQERSSPPL